MRKLLPKTLLLIAVIVIVAILQPAKCPRGTKGKQKDKKSSKNVTFSKMNLNPFEKNSKELKQLPDTETTEVVFELSKQHKRYTQPDKGGISFPKIQEIFENLYLVLTESHTANNNEYAFFTIYRCGQGQRNDLNHKKQICKPKEKILKIPKSDLSSSKLSIYRVPDSSPHTAIQCALITLLEEENRVSHLSTSHILCVDKKSAEYYKILKISGKKKEIGIPIIKHGEDMHYFRATQGSKKYVYLVKRKYPKSLQDFTNIFQKNELEATKVKLPNEFQTIRTITDLFLVENKHDESKINLFYIQEMQQMGRYYLSYLVKGTVSFEVNRFIFTSDEQMCLMNDDNFLRIPRTEIESTLKAHEHFSDVSKHLLFWLENNVEKDCLASVGFSKDEKGFRLITKVGLSDIIAFEYKDKLMVCKYCLQQESMQLKGDIFLKKEKLELLDIRYEKNLNRLELVFEGYNSDNQAKIDEEDKLILKYVDLK